jgi:two-component system sensor kinase FixL
MTSLSCSLEVPDDLPILNKVCAAQLYRIAYEAVTNTMKHAEAEHVSMSVEYGETELVMRITDDGKGIVRQEEKEGGIGIHIMNYRAQMLHGLVRVQSRPGEGTTVICKIPLSFLSRTDVAA